MGLFGLLGGSKKRESQDASSSREVPGPSNVTASTSQEIQRQPLSQRTPEASTSHPPIARGPSMLQRTPPTSSSPNARSMLKATPSFSERGTPLRTMSRIQSTRSRLMRGATPLELGLVPPSITPNYRPHPPPFSPSECVKVAVRVRPLSSNEQKEGCVSGLAADQRNAMIVVGDGTGGRAFKFDSVFGPSAQQQDVYEAAVREVVNGMLSGYNGTVLAYGQTGSGKTHTMGTGAIAADLIRAADPDLDPDPPTPLTPLPNARRFAPDVHSPTTPPPRPTPSSEPGSCNSYPIRVSDSDDGDDIHSEEDDGFGEPSPLPNRYGAAPATPQPRPNQQQATSSAGPRPIAPFDFPVDVGMLPRVARQLYEYLTELKRHHDHVNSASGLTPDPVKPYRVSVQFLEIYNEEVRDLLDPSTNPKDVNIRDKAGGQVEVTGAAEKEAPSYTSLMQIFAQGVLNRTVGATKMNAVSSRSHAIFTIHLEQRTKDAISGASRVTTSKLHLVDLAGSERAKRTGAEGTRFKESVNINQGLLALGNVISALGEIGQKGGDVGAARHVPYRDSKLTRMLQDSLGGNSQTVMIACVTAADASVAESVNTLKYAQRARMIRNRPVKIEALLSSLASDEYSAKMKQLTHFLEHYDQMSSVPDLQEFGDEVLWAMMIRLKKLTEKKRARRPSLDANVDINAVAAAAVAAVTNARSPLRSPAPLSPRAPPPAPLQTPKFDVAVEADFPSPPRYVPWTGAPVSTPHGPGSSGRHDLASTNLNPLNESLNFASPDLAARVLDASAIGQVLGNFEDVLRNSQLSPRAAGRLKSVLDRCMDIIGGGSDSLNASGALQLSLEFPQPSHETFASSMDPLGGIPREQLPLHLSVNLDPQFFGANSRSRKDIMETTAAETVMGSGRASVSQSDEEEEERHPRSSFADGTPNIPQERPEGPLTARGKTHRGRHWTPDEDEEGQVGTSHRTPSRRRGETVFSEVSGVSPLSMDSKNPRGQFAQMGVEDLDRLLELEQADTEVLEAQMKALEARRRQEALQQRLEAEKMERERMRIEAEEAERMALEEAAREAEEAALRAELARKVSDRPTTVEAPKGTYAALRARMAQVAASKKELEQMQQQRRDQRDQLGGPGGGAVDGKRSGSAGGYSRSLSNRRAAQAAAAQGAAGTAAVETHGSTTSPVRGAEGKPPADLDAFRFEQDRGEGTTTTPLRLASSKKRSLDQPSPPFEVSPGKTPLGVTPARSEMVSSAASAPGPQSVKSEARGPVLAVLVPPELHSDHSAATTPEGRHPLLRTFSGRRKPSPTDEGSTSSRRLSRGNSIKGGSAIEELRQRLTEHAESAEGRPSEGDEADTLQSAASRRTSQTAPQLPMLDKFGKAMIGRDNSEKALGARISHSGSEKFARSVAKAALSEVHRRTSASGNGEGPGLKIAGSLNRQPSIAESITPTDTPREDLFEATKVQNDQAQAALDKPSPLANVPSTRLLAPQPSLAAGLLGIHDLSRGSEAYEDDDDDDEEGETEPPKGRPRGKAGAATILDSEDGSGDEGDALVKYGSGAAAALRAQIAALSSAPPMVTPPKPTFSPLPSAQTPTSATASAASHRDYLGLETSPVPARIPSAAAAAAAAGGSYAAKLAALKSQRQAAQQQTLQKTVSTPNSENRTPGPGYRDTKPAVTPGGSSAMPPPPAKFAETPRGRGSDFSKETSANNASVSPSNTQSMKGSYPVKAATLPVRRDQAGTPLAQQPGPSPTALSGLKRLLSPRRPLQVQAGFHEPSLSELPNHQVAQALARPKGTSRAASSKASKNASAAHSPPPGSIPSQDAGALHRPAASQGPAPDLGAAAAEMAEMIRRSNETVAAAAASAASAPRSSGGAALRPPTLKLDLVGAGAAGSGSAAVTPSDGVDNQARLTTMLSARSRARRDLEEMVRTTEAQVGEVLSSKPSTRHASTGRFPSVERPPRPGTANGTGPSVFATVPAGGSGAGTPLARPQTAGPTAQVSATVPMASSASLVSPAQQAQRDKEDSWALFDEYLSSAEKGVGGRPSKAWQAPLSIGNGPVVKRPSFNALGTVPASPSRKGNATAASGGASGAAVGVGLASAAGMAGAGATSGPASRPRSVQRSQSGKGTGPAGGATGNKPLSRQGSANGRPIAGLARTNSTTATAPAVERDDGWVPTKKVQPLAVPPATPPGRLHNVDESLRTVLSNDTF